MNTSLSQHSIASFKKTLEKLTDRVFSGATFGMPMAPPYLEIVASVNRGKAVRLYKYQRCSDRNFEDVRLGRVHLCAPDAFNDIYDSRPYFDLPSIKQRMAHFITREGIARVAAGQRAFVPPELRNLYDEAMTRHIANLDEDKANLIAATEEELYDRYNAFRGEINCACFSSDPTSSVMWGNYADNCRGFIAAYDIKADEVKCSCAYDECDRSSMVFSLCPVLYDGRFDMSELSHVLMGSCTMIPYPTYDAYMTLLHATVHKGADWNYEKEWRLFTGTCGYARGCSYAALVPSKLILGPKIGEREEGVVRELGLYWGIPVQRAVSSIESLETSLRIVEL